MDLINIWTLMKDDRCHSQGVKIEIKLHFCIVWHFKKNQNENNHFPGIRETFRVVILKTVFLAAAAAAEIC